LINPSLERICFNCCRPAMSLAAATGQRPQSERPVMCDFLEARWTVHTRPSRCQNRDAATRGRDVLESWDVRPGRCRNYLLFSNPSSMYVTQKPLGFALMTAFLITVIFIVVS
jgi:hypothetical protein